MPIIKKKNANSALNTRVIIGVCVFILLIIPLIIWSLGFNTNRTSSPKKSPLASYQGSTYTINYPNNWSESESAVVNSAGQVVYLQPSNADPIIKPHVIVKVVPATQKAITIMNLSYTLLKYRRTDTTVGGVTAQKYSQVLQSVHGPFHSIAYVFQKNGNLYLVELGYTQKNTDPQLENEFGQIVNDFTFN